jgi:MSHA pilin protein MshA
MNMIKSVQRGFTLIELVVVIVILGILAAFAVPRFMGLETEARIATVRSMAGTVQSAVAMAHGVCLSRGCSNAAINIPINGVNVNFVNQYPNAASVVNLVEAGNGFTFATGRFTKTGAKDPANCWVQYNPPAAANTRPTYTFGGTPNSPLATTTEANITARLRLVC